MTIDAGGIIWSVNRRAADMFGYSIEDLVDQPIEILVPERMRPVLSGHRDGYFSDPNVPTGSGLELAGLHRDGSEFPIDISLSTVRVDGGVAVVATMRVVSERMTIETDFPGLLEAAQDAIVTVNAEGVIYLANQKAEALFGYSRDELIGAHLDSLIPDRARSVHPGHTDAYFADPTSRLMGAGLDVTARRKDGTELAVDISLSFLESEHGRLVSAAVRDVSDRRLIEEVQDRRDAQVIEVERGEERAGFEAQLQQAQRLESIGQLAGGVAHDFNNLLAAIMNYACLVSDSLQEQMLRLGLLEDQVFVTIADDVEEITHIAKRSAVLVHQLLTFSRRTVVQPEVLDLNAIVGEMHELLQRTLGENVDDLRIVLASGLPHIKADRGQIEQVIMNLAVNARDALPGGGRLEISTSAFEADELYARSRAVAPGAYVRLAVSDTGTGMSPEVVARAFEPYFTTKATGEGSGLGLPTVYGIVTQAGGEVVIHSELGAGTTLEVILPATFEAVSAPRDVRPPVPVTARGETVLLVEDEEIVREPVRRILARNDYTVLVARNAEEASAMILSYPGSIDLLLTDVVMPGRSGRELATDLLIDRPTTKVLFMSGYSQDVNLHQGVVNEGFKLIEKPFTSDELLRAIRDVLEGAA